MEKKYAELISDNKNQEIKSSWDNKIEWNLVGLQNNYGGRSTEIRSANDKRN